MPQPRRWPGSQRPRVALRPYVSTRRLLHHRLLPWWRRANRLHPLPSRPSLRTWARQRTFRLRRLLREKLPSRHQLNRLKSFLTFLTPGLQANRSPFRLHPRLDSTCLATWRPSPGCFPNPLPHRLDEAAARVEMPSRPAEVPAAPPWEEAEAPIEVASPVAETSEGSRPGFHRSTSKIARWKSISTLRTVLWMKRGRRLQRWKRNSQETDWWRNFENI